MTFGGWQSTVQTEFAVDVYRQIWPDCEVIENDSLGKTERVAKILDWGDVDKIILVPNGQKHMAQRFRKPWGDNNEQDPDFTLRYSRPYSTKTVEYERLMTAHDSGVDSYPRLYSFGRVYNDHSEGLYELYILDTDALIDGIKSNSISEMGPYKTQEGQELMAYKLSDIRSAGAILYEWNDGSGFGESDDDAPNRSAGQSNLGEFGADD